MIICVHYNITKISLIPAKSFTHVLWSILLLYVDIICDLKLGFDIKERILLLRFGDYFTKPL